MTVKFMSFFCFKWQKAGLFKKKKKNQLNTVGIHIFKLCALSTSVDASFATNANFLDLVALE
jgi:hypothetical protein